MKMAPDIREQRKAAQLARIKVKATDDPDNPAYPAMYANQPAEVRKGEDQRTQRRALSDAQRAIEVALGLDAQGAVGVFGGQVSAAVGIANEASASGSS